MIDLTAAKRSLIERPGDGPVLNMLALGSFGTGDRIGSGRFAARALHVRPGDVEASFLLCMVAIGAGDARSDTLRRRLLCLAPSDQRSLYCAIWYSQAIVDAPVLLLTDSRREEIYRWLMRSQAALGFQPFNAAILEQYFHDRPGIAFMQRLLDHLGHVNTGNIRSPGRKQYLFHTDLIRYIGEVVAVNDCLHKMMKTGRLQPGELNFIGDRRMLANQTAFDLWSESARFVSAPPPSAEKMTNVILPFGKHFFYKWTVFAIVQKAWEKKKLPPLLKRADQDRLSATFGLLVAERGWHRDDKIVCLHVREDIYDRGTVNNKTQAFRNTDPRKFLDSIRYLIENGYRIIRIGTTGSYAYPLHPSFFDYANSSTKAPELDVAIMGNCHLYFGTDSGPLSVSYVFGKPVCVVDFAQLPLGLISSNSVYSPRLYRRAGRFLTLHEMVQQPFRYVRHQTTFDESGVELVENGEDDICLVLREFLERLPADSYRDESTFGARQMRARKILKRNKVLSNGLISEAFLEKYPFLLDG